MTETREEKATRVAEALRLRQIESVGGFFSQNAEGEPITRDRTCSCGRVYTQTLLSERFLTMVERRGERAMALMRRHVPDFYVPVFCPKCERTELAALERMYGR